MLLQFNKGYLVSKKKHAITDQFYIKSTYRTAKRLKTGYHCLYKDNLSTTNVFFVRIKLLLDFPLSSHNGGMW